MDNNFYERMDDDELSERIKAAKMDSVAKLADFMRSTDLVDRIQAIQKRRRGDQWQNKLQSLWCSASSWMARK